MYTPIILLVLYTCSFVSGGTRGNRGNHKITPPTPPGPTESSLCSRIPTDTKASKTPGDNGFRIKLIGRPQPEGYIGGQVYTGEYEIINSTDKRPFNP